MVLPRRVDGPYVGNISDSHHPSDVMAESNHAQRPLPVRRVNCLSLVHLYGRMEHAVGVSNILHDVTSLAL